MLEIKDGKFKRSWIHTYHSVTVTKGTWLGRPAESWTIFLSSNKFGRRIVIHRWLDTRQVEVKLVEGDGRKDDFVVFGIITLENPDDHEVARAVDRLF